MKAVIPTRLNFYVVETDIDNPHHHGLNSKTLPHQLTTNPRRGDKIFAVCRGLLERHVIINKDNMYIFDLIRSYYMLNLFDDTSLLNLKFLSHAGRAIVIGEDQYPESRDCITQIVIDELNYIYRSEGGGYFPVTCIMTDNNTLSSIKFKSGKYEKWNQDIES